MTEPAIIDVDAIDWQRLLDAVAKSQWMPAEYIRNDWMSDLCDFLENGPAPEPVVSVQEMKTSAGVDHFVHIRVADREITPHVFKERWKADYEVAEWKWLFGQGEKPDLLAYGPDRP